MKSIGLAEGGYSLFAFLNPVMNISFPQNGGNISTTW